VRHRQSTPYMPLSFSFHFYRPGNTAAAFLFNRQSLTINN